MSDKKISELVAADNANSTDLFETSQVSGMTYESKKVTLQQLMTAGYTTFTTTFTGAGFTTGNHTIRLNVSGNVVNAYIPAFRGTANTPANITSTSNLPAAYRPVSNVTIEGILVLDDGGWVPGYVTIGSSGSITFGTILVENDGPFSGAGDTGIYSSSFAWFLT